MSARRWAESRAGDLLDALLAPSVTRRLIEVLRLVGRGLSNGEIAGELCVGDATVKSHVSRILHKLTLRDRKRSLSPMSPDFCSRGTPQA